MRTSFEIGACPACGHEASHELADADELKRELEQLWRFHERRLRPGTPPDRLVDRLAFTLRPALRLARCAVCRCVFRNPRERGVEESYREEQPGRDALRRLHDAQRPALRGLARRIADRAGSSARGLEVGSYAAAFLSAARDAGLAFEGVDVNEAAVAWARELGFAARTASIEDVEDQPGYDVIAVLNCLDQLPDPYDATRHAHRLLKPGGLLVARVPNGGFYAALRDRRFARAALAHHNLLAFPYRTGFTVEALGAMLRRAGFTDVQVRAAAVLPGPDGDGRAWAQVESGLARSAARIAPARAAPWIEAYAVAGSSKS